MAIDAEHADWRAHTRAVLDEVFAERERVVEVERFGPEHDDSYSPADALALAAACYAAAEHARRQRGQDEPHALTPPALWPWMPEFWKPRDERRNLIRALQLAVAAVCRLDRDAHRAEASRLAVEDAARRAAIAHTPGVREFARIDVVVELLTEILLVMPRTITVAGSADPHPHMRGVVRLILDVTATGLRGGDWRATIHDDAGRRTVSFGPVDPTPKVAS